MLKKEEIKNGQLVYSTDTNTYHIISDVGNAIDKGDRDESIRDKDELSYSITNIITEEVLDGICENSGVTVSLKLATVDDASIYLDELNAKAYLKLAKANVRFVKVQQAKHRLKNGVD